MTLRKHAYSNILKIFQPKKENVLIKISDIFHISVQKIDCGYSLEPPRRGGSNEYPQSMFLSRNKKNNVRGMFEMNCLLSSSAISTWGTIKTNTYLYRVIQHLHNGVKCTCLTKCKT